MNRLILVRHGRAAGAEPGVMHGWTDHPLDDLGRAQAVAAGRALAGRGPIDHLVSSPLPRTVETAELVAGATGLRPMFDDDLRELHLGDLSGGTEDVLWAYVADQVVERLAHPDAAPDRPDWLVSGIDFPGGETAAAFVARVERALERLDALEGTVVAVSHGVWIMAAVGILLGTDLLSWPQYRSDNATLTEVVLGPPAELVTLNQVPALG